MRPKISFTIATALAAGIFISDVLTPVGVAEWLFYIIPLFIASRVLKPLYISLFTSAETILMILGFFLSPRGADIAYDIVNRTMGVCGLWVITFLIIKSKRDEERIIELNRRLNGYVDQLEVLNRELETFSYAVSHDLKAPLRHISGFMKLLQKRLGDYPDVETRDYMNAISEASKKMGVLIDDVLAFSRITRVEIRKEKVSFNALVKAAIGDIQHDTKARDIIWDIYELPDVYGDQSMLSLVLNNLICNAVKYTRTRARAEIKIGYKEDKDEIIFFVKDNGVGFDMKYVDRLFGVFQRLHTQNEFEGTGIGLANVQRIIARHGGKVRAEGVVGQGATFYFTLPKMKEV